jgi:hypothetical protein
MAEIFPLFRTMPSSFIKRATSEPVKSDTFSVEKLSNAFFVVGHFFSTTLQFNPA